MVTINDIVRPRKDVLQGRFQGVIHSDEVNDKRTKAREQSGRAFEDNISVISAEDGP